MTENIAKNGVKQTLEQSLREVLSMQPIDEGYQQTIWATRLHTTLEMVKKLGLTEFEIADIRLQQMPKEEKELWFKEMVLNCLFNTISLSEAVILRDKHKLNL